MNKKLFITLAFSMFLGSTLASAAIVGSDIAKKFKLVPVEKAGKQWVKFLSSKEKMADIGADKLSEDELEALKEYLVSRAADSDQPTVPGK